jgi:hypothetical protein
MSLEQKAKTYPEIYNHATLRLKKWVSLEDVQELEAENALINQHNIDVEKENVVLAKKLLEAKKDLGEEKEFLTPSLKRLRMYLTMKETEGTK